MSSKDRIFRAILYAALILCIATLGGLVYYEANEPPHDTWEAATERDKGKWGITICTDTNLPHIEDVRANTGNGVIVFEIQSTDDMGPGIACGRMSLKDESTGNVHIIRFEPQTQEITQLWACTNGPPKGGSPDIDRECEPLHSSVEGSEMVLKLKARQVPIDDRLVFQATVHK